MPTIVHFEIPADDVERDQEWDIWHIVLKQKITVSVFGRPTKAQSE